MSEHFNIQQEKRRFLQRDFPPEEFKERRRKIFEAIGSDAHALIPGKPAVRGFHLFRQSNEFYYCCGIEIPHAYLLMSGAEQITKLFIPETSEKRGSEALTLTLADAELIKEHTGIDEVYPLKALKDHLREAKLLYVPFSPAEGRSETRYLLLQANRFISLDPWDGRLPREQHFIGLLRTRFPQIKIRDLSPILDEMRLVKSSREIKLLRIAGHLAALAVKEAMRATKPGMMEYQLRAIANCVYMMYGAWGEGYRSIIASGRNIWDPHYFLCDCEMRDGDLVLMDSAPEYHYYTSDIGRIWPVNGTYSSWQRKLYGFIVEYHKTLLRHIRPGLTADQIMDEAASEMEGVIERIKFPKKRYLRAAQQTLKFRGHLSHTVGMSVHDVGDYRSRPLKPGIVFSVDPQMWIPEERLYIRVEDTVVVTESGIEVLTRSAPLEPDDVEAVMKEKSTFDTLIRQSAKHFIQKSVK